MGLPQGSALEYEERFVNEHGCLAGTDCIARGRPSVSSGPRLAQIEGGVLVASFAAIGVNHEQAAGDDGQHPKKAKASGL